VINVFTGAETTISGEAPVSLDLQPDELRMVMWEYGTATLVRNDKRAVVQAMCRQHWDNLCWLSHS
jgi:hypothetical protein